MSVEVIGGIGVLIMLLFMAMRVPIAIAMVVPAVVGIYYIRGWDALATILFTIVWDHTASYTLVTIPMFVFMGQLLFMSGISSELFTMFKKWTGSLKGGLGITTIGSSAIFAAASGSSLANTGTMGVIAAREMLRAGYDKSLSAAAIIAGGTLGILIPPSTAFILYGIITETSIGKLLLAGIIPGLVLTFLYMLIIYTIVWLRPHLGPAAEKASWKERLTALKYVVWIIVLFIVVMGGMYLGIFSPTEASGVGAFSALVIALLKRKITLKGLMEALISTLKTTSFIFAILIGAFILNYFLAITKVPNMLTEFLVSTNLSTTGILIVIILMYIILGAIMDSMAMLVITLPIILPTLASLGIDLIWFGVLIVVLCELAIITPPVGILCFVLDGVAPELGLNKIFKGALFVVVPILIMIVLLIIFPELALFIPNSSY